MSFKTRTGFGIRWPETAAPAAHRVRDEDRGAPLVRRPRRAEARSGAPSTEITFDGFCELFLERHGATVSARTKETLADDSHQPRQFGAWTLRELEDAADDFATWRASSRHVALPADAGAAAGARRRRALALPRPQPGRRRRPNPEPRAEELLPFTPDEIDALEVELGPVYGPLVVSPPRRGCARTSGSRSSGATSTAPGRAVAVQRRVRGRRHHAVPENGALARRVPLTASALARSTRCRRDSTRRSVPGAGGRPLALDNWRTREWYPALDAAGIGSAARTTCGTRSRRRRSRPASRSSSCHG